MNIIGTSRSGHNFIKNNIESWKNIKLKDIENPTNKNFERNSIICLRDYLNTVASLANIRVSHIDISIRSWKSLADIAFGNNGNIFIIVFYEKFKDSRSYREKICKLVGGNYNENKLKKLPKGGMPSSFDGCYLVDGKVHVHENYNDLFDDNADLLDTNNRWKQIQENSKDFDYYISKLKQFPDVLKIYSENYQLSDEKKAFIKKYL